MLDTAQLWSVEQNALVEWVIDRVTNTEDDGTVVPVVIAVTNGSETLNFSPSYTDAELQKAFDEYNDQIRGHSTEMPPKQGFVDTNTLVLEQEGI